MNIKNLMKYLSGYNESELFYKSYHYAKTTLCEKEFSKFIDEIDRDYIIKNNLIIPELSETRIPHLMLDETYFYTSSKNNVILSKHNRYTPEFFHKHIFFEIVYVLSGGCTQQISNKEIKMTSGDIGIISPNTEHSIKVTDESIIINILIKRTTFEDIFYNFLRNNNILSSFFLSNLYAGMKNDYILFSTRNDAKIKKYILEMFLEYKNSKEYSSDILDHMIMIFFARLLRSHKDNFSLPTLKKKAQSDHLNLITYIQDNYNNITLENISREFHFSVPYCSKLIKDITGYTFTKFVQNIRLKRAETLLINTNIPISSISETIGYPNVEHFIRLFKREFNYSPSNYRKLNTL